MSKSAAIVRRETGVSATATPTPAIASNWRDAAFARLLQLGNLQTGWDGHYGKPLDEGISTMAAALLERFESWRAPMPAIMPLSDGGVQIEWHRKGWDIEIEMVSKGEINVFAHDILNGVEDNFLLSDDVDRVKSILKKISS